MAGWKFKIKAIDPREPSKTWETGITEAHYRRICNQGHEKQQARILNVEKVLADPIRLIGGWSRPDKEDCCIYVGRPESDFHCLNPMIEVPAPKRYPLFLVFVLANGNIDEWAWRASSDSDPDAPAGVEGEIIWP